MARNKNIQKLLHGIMEDPAKETPLSTEAPEPISTKQLEEAGLSEELVEALQKKRLEGAGRPSRRGASPRSSVEDLCKIGETRATFIVRKETLKKVKYVSLMDTKKIKDVIEEALTDYLSKWEAENGTIKTK